MSSAELFWIEGPWPRKLALAARPRGGDWLEDEMVAWSRSGAGTVLSLLTLAEESSLDLESEASAVRDHHMRFVSFPIDDRQVPTSPSELAKVLERIEEDLRGGRNVVVHCRQGVGRSGLVAACLLTSRGLDSKTAIDRISKARGVPVPETAELRRWIDYYISSLVNAR